MRRKRQDFSGVWQTETGYDRENGKTMPEREKVDKEEVKGCEYMSTTWNQASEIAAEGLCPAAGEKTRKSGAGVTTGTGGVDSVTGKEWKRFGRRAGTPFEAYLENLLPGGPFTLKLQAGTEMQEVTPVYVGDVFVCAGRPIWNCL